MFAPGKALVALPAGQLRVYRDQVTLMYTGNSRANIFHDRGTLVPDRKRVLHDLVTDPAGLKIVHVGAANADRFHAQQNIGR
jgi:hypothetical protein